MSEHQTTTEHSVYLMQLQALRQQGAIGEHRFAQLKTKLLSGNALDVQGAQKDIQTLQSPAHAAAPVKKRMGWLFKLFLLAVAAVVITIVYLLIQMPREEAAADLSAQQGSDDQVEILLPHGAKDVVPTFTPGESINDAFKAKQAAQDGLLTPGDGGQQVATTPTPAPLMPQQDAGTAQKATNTPKERDPINELVKKKQKEAQAKPATKKAAAENIDNLF
ncbi:MAG: hypothetical protein KA214_04925 [Neisseriaceae bacterium]|nr:hypothetical protein [Neisseriaceae bacterium]